MAIGNEAHLKNDIKSGNFAPCYIIFGNDGYLKKQNTENLIKAIVDPDDIFNYQKFTGESSLQEVYEAKEQLPMMADKKCVVLKDYDLEGCAKDDFEKLVSLCGEKNEDTVFILWFDSVEVDYKKSEKAKKIISACEKTGGRALLINHRQTGELVKMIITAVNKRGGSISSEAARYLIEYVSEDIDIIRNEIEKLCAFAGKNPIDKALINKICIKNIEQSIFDLSGKILRKDVGGALKILDELLYLRVKPIAILSTISSVYTDMYRASAGKKASVSLSDIVKDFSYGENRKFLVERAIKNLNILDENQIKLSLEELVRCDKALKNFTANDRIILEEMIVRLCYIISKGDTIDKA